MNTGCVLLSRMLTGSADVLESYLAGPPLKSGLASGVSVAGISTFGTVAAPLRLIDAGVGLVRYVVVHYTRNDAKTSSTIRP